MMRLFLILFLFVSCAGEDPVIDLETTYNYFGIGKELVPKELCEGYRQCDSKYISKRSLAVETVLVRRICPTASQVECGCGDLCEENIQESPLVGETAGGSALTCNIVGYFWGDAGFATNETPNTVSEAEIASARACYAKNMNAAMCSDRQIICFN